MSLHYRRGIASLALALVTVSAAAAPALASTSQEPTTGDGVTVVGGDSSNVHDVWADYTVLGVPIVGLVQSLAQVPSRLLPTS